MGRSRARLASDWFAKLRQNATTGIVEHTDVADVDTAAVKQDDSPTFDTVTANVFLGDGSGLTGLSSNGSVLKYEQMMSSSGTYTVPQDGVLILQVVGAGGSGGATVRVKTTATTALATGGGGSGYSASILNVSQGDQFVFTQGIGGMQVSTGTTSNSTLNGNSGGNTTLVGPNTNILITGGAGGSAVQSSGVVSSLSLPDVAGGVATGGQINVNGSSSTGFPAGSYSLNSSYGYGYASYGGSIIIDPSNTPTSRFSYTKDYSVTGGSGSALYQNTNTKKTAQGDTGVYGGGGGGACVFGFVYTAQVNCVATSGYGSNGYAYFQLYTPL